MSKKCVVCFESDVYHKPNCYHIQHMQPQNRLDVTDKDAVRNGCRICRYCNSMNYHFKTEQANIEYYKRARGMDFKYKDGVLYVKTEIGCWKLVYVRGIEKLILFQHYPESFP